jgi:hypothetical protein
MAGRPVERRSSAAALVREAGVGAVSEDYDREAADAEERWRDQLSMLGLEFYDVSKLVEIVDAAGPPRYLLRPVWAEGDYGVLGAIDKAGKTWMAADAAVSVASGTPWLGLFPVEAEGPVLFFVGEGGMRKLVRRLRAVCESRQLEDSRERKAIASWPPSRASRRPAPPAFLLQLHERRVLLRWSAASMRVHWTRPSSGRGSAIVNGARRRSRRRTRASTTEEDRGPAGAFS